MSLNPNPTHPRKTNRRSSPEHVDSIRNINTGIDKTNRLKKIRVANKLQHLGIRYPVKNITKVKRKKTVSIAMIQTAKNLSADAIINRFNQSKINVKGLNGVFDPIEGRVLDANIPVDAIQLQNTWEAGNNSIGFNSITDTRQGPQNDLGAVRAQLKEIEATGGNPALGFDEGSFEAVDVIVAPDDATILGRLQDNQKSTGILSPNMEFRIVDNPKFIG